MRALRFAVAGIFVVTALARALTVEAQQARIYRVGVLTQGGSMWVSSVAGLKDGLRELGLEEGKQVVFHVRDVRADLNSVEAAAKRFEDEKVDLICTLGTGTTLAGKRATKSVPIVFYAGADPVAVGLVESFRKPGGRLTGIHGQVVDLTAKRLELLRDIVPRLRRAVTFYNPQEQAAQQSVTRARDAARRLGVELLERPVASVDELRAGLRALRPGEADAYFQVTDPLVTSQADLIIQTAMAKRLPTMVQDKETVARGALASYGINYYIVGQLLAKSAQRVLLGANPGDLPVEQLDRLHFVVNLTTAKAIGLTIPQPVLARADEVVQ
jgi:putative ABC transport system substrate-binding protein